MQFITDKPVDLVKLQKEIAEASGWAVVLDGDVDTGITMTGNALDVPDWWSFDADTVEQVIDRHKP